MKNDFTELVYSYKRNADSSISINNPIRSNASTSDSLYSFLSEKNNYETNELQINKSILSDATETNELAKSKSILVDVTEINDLVKERKFLGNTMIELVAQWFLNKSSISHKKLQKLCYYAYCWFIVFFNDAEEITPENSNNIQVLFPERFQAWIHGPVSSRLYQRYRSYGWKDIPQLSTKPDMNPELESLLQQVWDAYGNFSADELESISHGETPWKNARIGLNNGDACSNEISDYDILQYYSHLE